MYKLPQNQNNAVLVQKLLDSTAHRRTSLQLGDLSSSKIASQITKGSVEVNNKNEDFQSYIDHGKKASALDIINQSQQYKNYQRDYKIMKGIPLSKQITVIPKQKMLKKLKKQQEINQIKKSQLQAKRQFHHKLKLWQQQKEKLKEKKRSLEEKKKMKENKSEQMLKKQQEAINEFLKLQKKKVIQCRIKQIEQRQKKRLAKQQSLNRHKSMPKFIEVEQKFKQNLKLKQVQVKILLKNRKSQLQMKMQEIKEHQKAYIDRIKQRLNIHSENKKLQKSRSKSIQMQKHPEEFNLFKKDLKQKIKLQDKLNRIKKFQNKIRLIPLNIDPQKKRQMEILADKLKNKKKYNFLSQKALSDQKIYQQFKQFDINIDKKQLGNQYFEQAKSLNRLSKKKASSQKVLPAKVQYKDYLKQKRQSRPQLSNSDNSGVKPSKQGKSFLIKQSQQYEDKVFSKIQQLKKSKNYNQSIQMQKQIDKNYMKALKAKLALAKIS